MDIEERLEGVLRRASLAWWHVVLIASAVVIAVSSIVVAYAQLRQADELRKANCADRRLVSQASNSGEAEDEMRRCLGVAERP